MGLEVLSTLSALSDGLYCICKLDCIVSAVLYIWIISYRMDWIVSYRLDQETLYFAHWLVTAWMGRMGRMGRMDWMGRWWDEGDTDGP